MKLPGHGGVYLSARIHDNTHAQRRQVTGAGPVTACSSRSRPGCRGRSSTWYEYGVALTTAGPQTYRWLAAEGSAGPVTGVDLKVTRDGAAKETIYELAMPWSELAPFALADRLMSLSFLVNDNDGGGRRSWIEWGSGIGGAKDPALFKPTRLDG